MHPILQCHLYRIPGCRFEIPPIKEYRELLEDLHDLAVVAERRDEPTISFTRLKEKLKTDGLL